LGTKLADVGGSILNAGLDQGKDLLANGAQGKYTWTSKQE